MSSVIFKKEADLGDPGPVPRESMPSCDPWINLHSENNFPDEKKNL